MKKILLGISSCLLGQTVRYDGGHKYDAFIVDLLGQYCDFRAICPEMGIGLGTPRTPIHLVLHGDNEVRCINTLNPTLDHTDTLQNYARNTQVHDLCGYILKKNSPSCGMHEVPVHTSNTIYKTGQGIYASTLMHLNPLLPIEQEDRLAVAQYRDNFLIRVYVMQRWQQMLTHGLSMPHLSSFHAHHKLLIMCHANPCQLEQIIAHINADNLLSQAQQYIAALMSLLKQGSSHQQHLKVFQHLQAHLTPCLSKQESAQLGELTTQYQHGKLALFSAQQELQQYLKKQHLTAIEYNIYLTPYPVTLRLEQDDI